MKLIEIPTDVSKKELFAFLLKNKTALIQQKKFTPKESNGFCYGGQIFSSKGFALKAAEDITLPQDGVLLVKAIINTTNYMDSRADVHMPGLWAKSLSDNKNIMHLQEHDLEFEKIIADGVDLKAYTKSFAWRDLGFDLKGKTEALVFDSMVREERNAFMYNQYAKGYVKNHSVYMQYVKMILCVNEPDDLSYGAEYEAWQKYLPEVVNKDDAKERGYFWAITEAKIIEGSAVPIGANSLTPTLSVTAKLEPPVGTPKRYKFNLSVPEKKGYKVGNKILNFQS
jgi:hypothetical protein